MFEDLEKTNVLPPVEDATPAAVPPEGVPAGAPERTALGVTLNCPVCGTVNPSLETFCVECGFLLSSQPGAAATEEQPSCPYALVDERTGRRYPLHEGENLIGREGGDVLLVDSTVSRRHAVITVSGNSLTITDQGSTNGTRVDGSPAPPGVAQGLQTGAVLQLGHVALRLEGPPTSSPTRPAPPVEEIPASSKPARPPVALLSLVEGHQEDIPIPSGTMTIGRRPGNDHVIASDPFVSGRHAQIDATETGLTITDLGSTNGTYVNGTRLEPAVPRELHEGDEVVIGKGKYTVTLPDRSDSSGLSDPSGSSDLSDASDLPDLPSTSND